MSGAEEEDGETLLSQLMAALASGARAVQGLPMDDEFEYQSSYPEFLKLIESNQESLVDLLLMVLSSNDDELGGGGLDGVDSLDDPLLWEACTDICEGLLEQAENWYNSSSSEQITNDLQTAKHQVQTSFGRLLKGIVEMEKPQDVYEFSTTLLGRQEPFVPRIREKYHAIQPLDLTLQPGHGLEGRFGELRGKSMMLPKNMIAPASHVPHCYQEELKALEYTSWQLAAPTSKPPKIIHENEPSATWIDTPEALQELTTRLETGKIREIALDLEAHSYRSFDGMICLIQITFGKENFLIDPFPLWDHLTEALGPVLANPEIVKVLHGADSDVQWLQRDFGLYIVNLFDTGRAARALRMASAGYAHLLHYYVGINADKSHQLSDWRQRPLPQAMKKYAIMDTHYLLDIYKHLKYDLEKHPSASIKDVLEESRKVSLIRYAPEPFKPEGYKSIMNRRTGKGRGQSKSELNETQEQVLKALWDWRDQIARQADESHAYVCTNSALMRLALACPANLTALQGLFQPMPPLLLRNSKEVLGLIQSQQQENTPHRSAFFKPSKMEDTPMTVDTSTRSLMSPVLGTEALYRQAGWISPHLSARDSSQVVVDIVTTDEDENTESNQDGTEMRPRRLLSVHQSNEKYVSNQSSSHSLQLGQSTEDSENNDGSESGTVDGLGAARAAAVPSQDSTIEEEVRLAKINAVTIRTNQEDHIKIIGLIPPSNDMEEGNDEDGDEDEDEGATEEKTNEEEFVIPRSMREIYRISNRNRRTKKSGSPAPEPNEKEARELAKAEEILKARSLKGKSYFDDHPGTPKRQRTKSTGNASMSSEEVASPGNNPESREEDIALMQEIGWVKDEDLSKMLKEGHDADDDDGSSEDETMKDASKPFDYSTIGPIGAFSSTPGANPFFSGAAVAGGHLNQQFGKTEKKKNNNNGNRGKQSRRQIERPEKRDARSQTYKSR